ncbi:DNA/RNA non-specific endonuclease [Spongiivirga citrea]|uniref:Endonuclease n=1 Tax=Spongiivirga citrea TaxID=1481457 RepID=A0A6M0CQC0_9FLAO|nr:DNA/RNA non-specific endonuclease [Spongiivirga citrea]NER18224.1 DNA/RNA non-specific endonuclease [Spongiivirga citrea]
MDRKKIYTLIALAIAVGVYFFEAYQKDSESEAVIQQGETVKRDTNTNYLPTSTTGQIVHHEGYSLSYNEQHEQAEWVAYELKKKHLSQNEFKRPYFEVDPAVRSGAAHWRNYKKSGYDRGHLCPAGDRRYSKDAFNETFLTSNISPQEHRFNSGIWNDLEKKTRYWAKRYDGVYVITGGILKGKMKTIGDEDVSVPNSFYKIIYDRSNSNPKMIAFLIPHKDSNKPLKEFVVTVDQIESLTGIDFFPEMENTLEEKMESINQANRWKF